MSVSPRIAGASCAPKALVTCSSGKSPQNRPRPAGTPPPPQPDTPSNQPFTDADCRCGRQPTPGAHFFWRAPQPQRWSHPSHRDADCRRSPALITPAPSRRAGNITRLLPTSWAAAGRAHDPAGGRPRRERPPVGGGRWGRPGADVESTHRRGPPRPGSATSGTACPVGAAMAACPRARRCQLPRDPIQAAPLVSSTTQERPIAASSAARAPSGSLRPYPRDSTGDRHSRKDGSPPDRLARELG